ncbi:MULTISPECIES: hypothetical protein [Bacillus]|nr:MULTISPECIES: hypothetical protein [Bacillus]BCC61106.1 hypothetical protein BCJMU10_4414 [Bacillus cereus]
MSKSSSPLKVGKETYGMKKIEKAFINALEMYFGKNKKSDV